MNQSDPNVATFYEKANPLPVGAKERRGGEGIVALFRGPIQFEMARVSWNENKLRKSYEVEKEIYTLDSIALLGILGFEIPKPMVKLSHSLIGAADGADEVLATRLHCVKDTDLDLIHRKAQASLMLEVLKEVVQVALELLIVEMRDGEGVLICCQETIWTTELDTISRAHNAGVI
jgi:hypothetical protein